MAEHPDSTAFTDWREQRKKKKAQAQQGKGSESAVKKWLDVLALRMGLTFAWERPVDTREAGGMVKATTGDFNLMHGGRLMTLEVKETQFDWLPQQNFKRPQINRLQRRALAGVPVYVLVHHTGLGVWRVCPIKPFFEQTSGRFETQDFCLNYFGSAAEALAFCTKPWFNT